MFIQNMTYLNLLLFLECASRLEHVGLNKYFWHIYKVTMTCFTTRHIQRGGGGWGQHFSTLRAPKLMTHWAPRVFDLLDTPLGIAPVTNQQLTLNSPVSFSASPCLVYFWKVKVQNSHCIMRKCRQPSAAQYKFYTLARFSLLLNVDITILYPNTQTLTVYM